MSWLNGLEIADVVLNFSLMVEYSKNYKTFLVAAKLKNIILLNLPVWILITSISAFNLSLSAQKEIKIEQDLKAHSKPLEVERRGIKAIGKYQFGSYEILSGQAGWVEYPGSFSLGEQLMEDITGMKLEKSVSKSSFILLSNQKDTIVANIFISNQRQIVEGNRQFVIEIDRDDLSRQIFAVRLDEEMKGVVATAAVSILLRDLDLRPDEF
jgi:hypothetical protein